MEDPNENFVVRFYYTNFPFFALIATGADTGLILVFLYGRCPELQLYSSFVGFTVLTVLILCVKMIINIS
jgi:hypothetical protein